MEELLVTWLSSDNVYENVLNLVETYRLRDTAIESPPSSPRRKMNEQQLQQELQAMNAKKNVTIPPFYRPPGTFRNGMKMKSIRRNRSDSFDSDQSWDGIYSVDSTASSSSSDPTKENTDANNHNATNHNVQSNIPIKEQVRNIFEERGKMFSKEQQRLMNSNHQSKYLTIDNFVKITKDICKFPTFFNKPLYKRILYLWNTQDIKTSRGKLILWNEYYLNADDIDIGVDPDDLSSKGDQNDNGEDGDKRNNKKKSNELLDQLDKFITYDIFKWYWTHEMEDFDLSERFYRLLKKPHEDYVGKDDFGPFIKELLNDHPVSCYVSIIIDTVPSCHFLRFSNNHQIRTVS